MTSTRKAQIGLRLREKRKKAGYAREKLGELCSLRPRFIANIELGNSTFSLHSLMTVCRVLSYSSDYLLFGDCIDGEMWTDSATRLRQIDLKYKEPVDKVIQGLLEVISKAER